MKNKIKFVLKLKDQVKIKLVLIDKSQFKMATNSNRKSWSKTRGSARSNRMTKLSVIMN